MAKAGERITGGKAKIATEIEVERTVEQGFNELLTVLYDAIQVPDLGKVKIKIEQFYLEPSVVPRKLKGAK